MALVSPDRQQVSVDDLLDISIRNPRSAFLLVDATPAAGGRSTDCTVRGTTQLAARCTFSVPGTYQVRLFGGPERYGYYQSVGAIEVHAH